VNRPLAGLLPLLLLVAACTGTDAPPVAQGAAPPPFADCAALATPPPGAVATPPPATGAGPAGAAGAGAAAPAGAALPDVRLPCFTGGAEVPLSALRGPAVVNLWASWCPPCRAELPAFQRLAERAGGKVHVVGVATGDKRDAAQSLAEDFGLTFPTLFDRDAKLRLGLERNALPITLFVDDQGRVRHLDTSGALDDRALAGLVQQHLGVAVSG
jgi:thiol-disulfide isomerase/thioredoxin